MDLDDIFIDGEESRLPELARLRIKKGWPQYKMAAGLGLNLKEYANIEYGLIDRPELEARIKGYS